MSTYKVEAFGDDIRGIASGFDSGIKAAKAAKDADKKAGERILITEFDKWGDEIGRYDPSDFLASY
jgi:hypothetical protein